MSGKDPGQVIIRSNVVLGDKRWDLVPGELLNSVPWRGMSQATRQQHDEQMYYQPCAVCHRTIAHINLTGCNQCTHAPSPASVEKALDEWCDRVDQALEREREENAALIEEHVGHLGQQPVDGEPT